MSKTLGANSTFTRSINSAGWALFFIWAGTALLADIGWTWWLIGAAIIILGVQAALYLKGERPDIFILAVGIVLLTGSIFDMIGSAFSFIPAFLIVIGVAMLANSVRGHPRAAMPEAGGVDRR
jgi:hypothetical protein